MIRLLAVAAMLCVPAMPALAESSLHDTHVEGNGATAGRSPHRAYRPVAVTESCGRPAMHSVPSGKGHVFGTHAFAAAPCEASMVASTDVSTQTGRD